MLVLQLMVCYRFSVQFMIFANNAIVSSKKVMCLRLKLFKLFFITRISYNIIRYTMLLLNSDVSNNDDDNRNTTTFIDNLKRSSVRWVSKRCAVCEPYYIL